MYIYIHIKIWISISSANKYSANAKIGFKREDKVPEENWPQKRRKGPPKAPGRGKVVELTDPPVSQFNYFSSSGVNLVILSMTLYDLQICQVSFLLPK